MPGSDTQALLSTAVSADRVCLIAYGRFWKGQGVVSVERGVGQIRRNADKWYRGDAVEYQSREIHTETGDCHQTSLQTPSGTGRKNKARFMTGRED